MTTDPDFLSDVEFIQRLKDNELRTPNEFTIEMGMLIRQAREDRGLSQVELSRIINRRPATISAIENGKSEIGILTLVLFAVVFEKPISYFFPPSLLKDIVVDIKSSFQQEILDLAKEIEHGGDTKLTIEILNLLVDRI